MKNLHWYYKFLIVFLIFFSMFFLFNKNISDFANSSLYKYYVDSIFIPISSMKRNLTLDYKNLIKENNYLKQKTLKDNVLEEENNNLKEEIEKLKKVMDVKTTYTGYKTIYAKTIIRNKMYWYNTITIDKGKDNDIKTGMVVINGKGLIGKVINVSNFTADVRLITTNDSNNKISVTITNGESKVIGLMNGYSYETNDILIEGVSNTQDVKVGDMVYTSGLGGVFPSGILVGTVESITTDSYGLAKIIKVKPSVSFDDINYVSVLKRSDTK